MHLDADSEAVTVLGYWDLPGDLSTMQISHLSNGVFGVGSDFILKRGERRQMARSVALIRALREACGHGALVGEPIAARSGAYCVEASDVEHVWSLSRALPGEPLPIGERFGDNCMVFAFKFGAAIAALHKALAAIGNGSGNGSGNEAVGLLEDLDLFEHVSTWALPNANVDDELHREYQDGFRDLCESLPRQLIHRDTHPENIMWLEGEVSGFIDFDIAQRNVRLWDVCYLATALLSDCPVGEREKWFGVLKGLLDGYASVSTLTRQERESVYWVIVSIQLVFIAWCRQYLGHDEIERMEKMEKTNREMLAFIRESQERIAAILKKP